MNWHLPRPNHDQLDMLRARLMLLERSLHQILETADSHEDPEEALMRIANLAEEALKL